ncbi:treslin isoform X2 [Pleurodeles waltl]|uniref:treslin isoform X2 n=1 Tax=Pleurodeles waltl TaxID=8319 RepID=UPI0037097925
MASTYTAVLLVDTTPASLEHRLRLRLVALRLLNYLGCRLGAGRVRWSSRCFDSRGPHGRPARLCRFRELGARSFEELEEELEMRGDREPLRTTRTRAPPPVSLTHTALKETLLDYQWDRPDITSPAKPSLLRSRGIRRGPSDEPLQTPGHTAPKSRNAIFLLSPCPHSQAELRRFLVGDEAEPSEAGPIGQELRDRLFPRSLQDLINSRNVALYWVDTSDQNKVYGLPDHVGYWTLFEQLQLVGGKMMLYEPFFNCSRKYFSTHPEDANQTSCKGSSGHSESKVEHSLPDLPFDSVLNCVLCNDLDYLASFPQQDGTFGFLRQGMSGQWNYSTVVLEPLSMNQRFLQHPVTITLKGTVKDWNVLNMCTFRSDSWVLRHSNLTDYEVGDLFLQLLQRLSAEHLHMITDVSTCEDLVPSTGILSPLSDGVALLTVLSTANIVEFEKMLTCGSLTDCSDDVNSDLPDIVNSVLNHVYSGDEDDEPKSGAVPVPDWVQQELDRTNRWSSSVVEGWYSLSNDTGASSDLMESFRLLDAVHVNEKDECYRFDLDMANNLSEFYQKHANEDSSSAGQVENKRRGIPRTPVRQKMKTMSRSLQMLNVARLNVKAQKCQHDDQSQPVIEKMPQKQRRHRSTNKIEKAKSLKISTDFETEKELLAFITDDYQKTITEEGCSLYSCAQNMIAVIKTYFKSRSTEDLELDCLKIIQSNLLKTGKFIRQQFGNIQDKEAKVRECQIQIFLRLEMCQCTSVQNNTDAMELLVEEMTDMLRILSLTEDPAYLTTFLEEVLDLYISSIPKILGNLYFSLGTQMPEKLATALPADIFGDDSLTHESTSPTLSHPPASTVPSTASINKEADQLEELRTRSAKKRRSSLARHRSINETVQNLRQIELPKLPKGQMKRESSHSYLTVVVEKLQMPLVPPPPPPKKEATQEVTKVRRNLFNQEIRSPTKRSSKMPRSQSVSAVEGVKHRRSLSSDSNKDNYKLLTKKVTETPLHKQVSNRLLHKQMKGRCSDSSSEVAIVEESPEKSVSDINVRRSPRIKELSINRRHSSSFYSFSQPKSRNLERVNSASQLQMNSECTASTSLPVVQSVKSPKRLLFGAVLGMNSPPHKKRLRQNLSCEESASHVISSKLSEEHMDPVISNQILWKSPCVLLTDCRTPRKMENAACSQSKSVKSLEKYFSPTHGECKSDPSIQITPQKHSGALIDCSPVKNADQVAVARPFRASRSALSEESTPKSKIRASQIKQSASKMEDLSTPRKKSMRTPRKAETNVASTCPTSVESLKTTSSPAGALQSKTQDQCTPRKCTLPIHHTLETLSASSASVKNTLLLDTLSPKVLLSNLQDLCTPKKNPDLTHQKLKQIVASGTQVETDTPLATSPTDFIETKLHGFSTPSKSHLTASQKLSAFSSPTSSKSLDFVKSPAKIVETNVQNVYSPKKNILKTPQKPETLPASGTPAKSPYEVWDINMQELCTPQKSHNATTKKLVSSTPSKTSQLSCGMVSPSLLITPGKINKASPKTPSTLPVPPFSSPLKASLRSWSSLNSPSAKLSSGLNLPPANLAPDSMSRVICGLRTETKFETTYKSPSKVENCSEGKKVIECEGNLSPHHFKAMKGAKPSDNKSIFSTKKESSEALSSSEKVLNDSPISPRKNVTVLNNGISLLNCSINSQLNSEVRVVCERLDSSSLTISSTSDSLASSQMDESIDISEAKVLPTEGSGLKMKLLVTRKPSHTAAQKPLPAQSEITGRQGDFISTPTYELRCTPDRKQREATARHVTQEIPSSFSTPKSQKRLVPAGTPTYEVELEMQASGLPKLRIKRTDSCSSPDIRLLQKKTSTVSHKQIGDESPFSEPNSPWCGRHANKVESICVSPSFCRSSYNTPGKSGIQTYICHSYTPTRGTSNTTSPCCTDVGVPWTPSPKHKEKTTDTIKNWPRRKKAVVICSNATVKNEKTQDCINIASLSESGNETTVLGTSSKATGLGEFELEGVSQLPDQSPVTDWDFKAEESSSISTYGLKSRKRRHECLSPEKSSDELPCFSDFDLVKNPVKDQIGTVQQASESPVGCRNISSSNKSSAHQSSVGDDDVFSFAGLTPPNKIIRSSLSASGLMALTHSPLLFQGKNPSSKRKDDFDLQTPTKKVVLCSVAEKDDSPFSGAVPQRSVNRTYTRKKLLS